MSDFSLTKAAAAAGIKQEARDTDLRRQVAQAKAQAREATITEAANRAQDWQWEGFDDDPVPPGVVSVQPDPAVPVPRRDPMVTQPIGLEEEEGGEEEEPEEEEEEDDAMETGVDTSFAMEVDTSLAMEVDVKDWPVSFASQQTAALAYNLMREQQCQAAMRRVAAKYGLNYMINKTAALQMHMAKVLHNNINPYIMEGQLVSTFNLVLRVLRHTKLLMGDMRPPRSNWDAYKRWTYCTTTTATIKRCMPMLQRLDSEAEVDQDEFNSAVQLCIKNLQLASLSL